MNAKAESPTTSKTSTEKKVAAAKAAADAVTAADVKKAIAAPKVDAPKKRGPKKAVVQNEETVVVAEAAEGMTEEAAPKKRGRKPGVKNSTSKKETVKKTTTKKTAQATEEEAVESVIKKPEEQITIQYAGRECTKDDLMSRVNEVWVNEYGKEASEMQKVAFYVKPEEFAVYYVINDDITGKFDI